MSPHRIKRLRGIVVCVLSSAVAWGASVSSEGAVAPLPVTLVPASFHSRSDALGHRWDLDQSGRVQSGYFGGAFGLSINGQGFNGNGQAMMTADGSELVFSATMAGLQVTRRVRIDLPGSTIRFLEILANPGAAPVSANLTIQMSLGYSTTGQMLMTDSGSPGAVLGKKDSGLVQYYPTHGGGSPPSILFYLAHARSRLKPSIQQQGNSQFSFSYTLTVPPGKTAIVLHGAAQRQIPAPPDAKALASLMAPFHARSWTADVPAPLRRLIANAVGAGGGWEDSAASTSLAALDVKPGTSDVLAIGPQTRLSGTATFTSLGIETRYGRLSPAPEKVLALVGEKSPDRTPRVLLRDGQVYRGKPDVKDLRFVMHTGLTVQLDVAHLDRLVMRAGPDDGKPAPGASVMLETTEGERIAVASPAGQKLVAVTPWGPRPIDLDEVLLLTATEDRLGHRISLRDGSRLFAFLEGASLALKTLAFGPQQFSSLQVRSLTAAQGLPADGNEPSITAPYFTLGGENVLAGQIELPALHFLASGQRLPVPPAQIRHLRRASDAAGETDQVAPAFEGELWDGSQVAGTLDESILPVRSGGQLVQIPVHDVLEAHVPTPVVPDVTRKRIADLIRDLGHAEYAKRTAASVALAGLGSMAVPQLNETLKQTTDPEVRRSVQSLLQELKE